MARILRDQTAMVTFEPPTPDGELLTITKCVCEKTFPAWFLTIGCVNDQPDPCLCSKLLCFNGAKNANDVRVTEVIPL